MNKRTILLLLLILLLLGAPALAQISAQYDLSRHILSGGGGSRRSPAYQIDDALGQWANGSSSSPKAQIDPGFWPAHQAAEAAKEGIYIPLVLRAL